MFKFRFLLFRVPKGAKNTKKLGANFFSPPVTFFGALENRAFTRYMKNMNFEFQGRVIAHFVGIER